MHGKANYLCPIITSDRFHTSLVGLKYSIKTLFYTYIQKKGNLLPPPTKPAASWSSNPSPPPKKNNGTITVMARCHCIEKGPVVLKW